MATKGSVILDINKGSVMLDINKSVIKLFDKNISKISVAEKRFFFGINSKVWNEN